MPYVGSRHRRQKRSGRKFIELWTNVKRSAAYHSLSLPARCTLIELLDRSSGVNNGMIGLGVRELANELRSSTDTAARALRELDDSGLARPVTGGHWRGKRATEWRLTFIVCHKTGELPQHNWTPRQVSDEGDTKVRSQGHKPLNCTTTRTHIPKSPISDPPKCTTSGTHIDVYQGDTCFSPHTTEPSERAQPCAEQRASEPLPDPWADLEIPEFLRRPS